MKVGFIGIINNNAELLRFLKEANQLARKKNTTLVYLLPNTDFKVNPVNSTLKQQLRHEQNFGLNNFDFIDENLNLTNNYLISNFVHELRKNKNRVIFASASPYGYVEGLKQVKTEIKIQTIRQNKKN